MEKNSLYCYADCRYAECYYAECHWAECRGYISFQCNAVSVCRFLKLFVSVIYSYTVPANLNLTFFVIYNRKSFMISTHNNSKLFYHVFYWLAAKLLKIPFGLVS
jgi:hypothetical protein